MYTNEWLLQIALIIYSTMLNHKVIEQYRTKQPRWSSDVIKALHQVALLLGALSRSFPLFSAHFRASAFSLYIISTHPNMCQLNLFLEPHCLDIYIFHSLSYTIIICHHKNQKQHPHFWARKQLLAYQCPKRLHFDLKKRKKLEKTTIEDINLSIPGFHKDVPTAW